MFIDEMPERIWAWPWVPDTNRGQWSTEPYQAVEYVKVQKPIRFRKSPEMTGKEPFTEAELSDRIDSICGCKGQYDCRCISVFNKAFSELWYEYNTKGER